MFAPIEPGSCDVDGRPIGKPKHRLGFAPTFPMARYATAPLQRQCATLEEMRQFLLTCRYVKDRDQFGTPDYWMPPEDFEARREGDCDCFSLWAWRQLTGMGYEARFVTGPTSFGHHAWVMVRMESAWFICEPLAARCGLRLPRLYCRDYQPAASAAWDGVRVRYFEHDAVQYAPPMRLLAGMMAEYAWFHLRMLPLHVRGGLWFAGWCARGVRFRRPGRNRHGRA